MNQELSSETLYEVNQATYAEDRNAAREAKRVLANPTRETLRGTCSLASAMDTNHPNIRADFGWSN